MSHMNSFVFRESIQIQNCEMFAFRGQRLPIFRYLVCSVLLYAYLVCQSCQKYQFYYSVHELISHEILKMWITGGNCDVVCSTKWARVTVWYTGLPSTKSYLLSNFIDFSLHFVSLTKLYNFIVFWPNKIVELLWLVVLKPLKVQHKLKIYHKHNMPAHFHTLCFSFNTCPYFAICVAHLQW